MAFNREWLARFMIIFGYVMVLVYIVLGISLFFPRVFPAVPGNLKFVFAIFFISYGVFRFARIRYRRSETNEQEDTE